MDIHELRTLLMDIDCMTALRHVLNSPGVEALVRLCRACAQDYCDEGELTQAYCRTYNAWLTSMAKGCGGFAREVLEAVLFTESPAALLCAGTDELPYSLTNALGNDLDAFGRLVAIEPAMFLLLCERAGMSGQTAARLPVWEVVPGYGTFDPRIDLGMLSRNGVKRVAAFFRKHGTGLFARCPACTWVGVSEQYPLGLRGIREPNPVKSEETALCEREYGLLLENTRRLLAGREACNVLLCGDKGAGQSVKALISDLWQEGLRIVQVPSARLTDLPTVFSVLRERTEKCIVFVDDLELDDVCAENAAFKTVLEGGLEARPAHVAVYAAGRCPCASERRDGAECCAEKCVLADCFELKLGFGGHAEH